MFRFSLRRLMISVALVAIGLLCLLYASQRLSGCLSVAWLGLLLVAVLGVVYRSQRRRAFWLGFCVFGWAFAAYLHFVHDDTIGTGAIESFHDAVKWGVPASIDDVQAHARNGGTWENLSGGVSRLFFPRFHPFVSASHSLLGIAVAVIGGLIGQWFHATRDRGDREKS